MARDLGRFFGENKPEEGHGRTSLRGGVFSIGARVASLFVQVGSTIIVMRLLSPNEVGLVAMVTALTGFAPVLMDLGTRDAAVQKAKISEEEVSGLFWLSLGIGSLLALILVACSPLIASFYREPKLQGIALLSAVTFVVSAASCQHSALLRRAMMFQQIATIEVASGLFGSIGAIAMALGGMSYWALVAKPILTSAFTLVAVAWCCRWVPGFPRLTSGVREMLKFGLNVTGFTVTDYVSRAADRVAIGKVAGAASLGYYQNACFFYENSLGLLSISLHTVAVASLSKLRDNLDELRRSWAKALSTLAFYAMPAFGLLAVTAQDIVVIILGEKWRFTGALVAILALRGIPHVVERTLGWLHVPAGRSDRWMRWGVFACAVQLVVLFCGLPFGTIGIATAYVIAMYVMFIPAIAYAGNPVGIGVKDVLRATGPQLIAALAATGAAFALRFWVLDGAKMIIRLPLLIAACSGLYLAIAVGIFKLTHPLQVARSLMFDFLPKRIPWLKPVGAE